MKLKASAKPVGPERFTVKPVRVATLSKLGKNPGKGEPKPIKRAYSLGEAARLGVARHRRTRLGTIGLGISAA